MCKGVSLRRKLKVGGYITENRWVMRIGGAYYLNLPPEFVELHRIKPGDKVPITASYLLKVIPHSERRKGE